MYTSLAVLAMVGSLAGNIPAQQDLNWLNDYRQARVQAAGQKPLAVVVGTGKAGWGQLVKDGLDSRAKELLASNYVCLYADRSTDAGRKLAAALEIGGDTGLVISDRSGQTQAFSHSGELSSADLNRALERYSEPAREAQTTESLLALSPTAYPGVLTPGVVSAWGGPMGGYGGYMGGYGGGYGYMGGGCGSMGGCGGMMGGCGGYGGGCMMGGGYGGCGGYAMGCGGGCGGGRRHHGCGGGRGGRGGRGGCGGGCR